MSEKVELFATAVGNVQGVGFRYTTQRIAQTIGLVGTVRNCSDGSVEIIAQGEKEKLNHLLDRLKIAFPGKSQTIHATFRAPNSKFSDFSIL